MPFLKTTVKSILFFLFAFSSLSVMAQENSPYSRYGLGNLKQIESVLSKGMGGVAVADDNPLVPNPVNPATYASLRMTSYQAAMEGSLVTVRNSNSSNRTGSATFSYINIGFPLGKHAGLSFGLLPQTRSRYNMEKTDTLNFATATSSFSGGGGIQKIYIGAAYRYQDFSFGFNTGYNFGNLINGTETSYTDSLGIIPSDVNSRITMGGVFWQMGGLYKAKIDENLSLNIGVTYTGNQRMNATRETIWSYLINSNADTLYYHQTTQKGKVVMPSNFGAGMVLSRGDYWQIGLDLTTANWEKFTIMGKTDSTTRTFMVKLGGAITPDVNSVSNYWKKMTYRAGFNYGQDYLQFQGHKLNKMAFTVGAGYPIRRTNLSIGQINAALELGKRGTTADGLIREGFTRFSFGLTFNDKWFVKRKYD